MVLASQIAWSENVDASLQTISGSNKPDDLGPLQGVLTTVESTLNVLADSVLHEQPPVRRKKLEHLVSVFSSVTWCTHIFRTLVELFFMDYYDFF